MALGTFIAGPYSATYATIALGLTEDGFELRFRPEKQLVNQSDLYGDTILDAVYRGGNYMMAYNMIEYGSAVAAGVQWPYGPAVSTIPVDGVMGTVGMMDVASTKAKATILTAIAGTTAAATPATLTASQSILAEGSEVSLQFVSKLRTVPIAKRLYPYSANAPQQTSGSQVAWFTRN